MRPVLVTLLLISLSFQACHRTNSPAVDIIFTDSLLTHYSLPQKAIVADSNLAFWERRMKDQPENFVNGPKYAAALSTMFQVYGNISDLVKADSLVKASNKANNEKEPGLLRSLASLALMQHQFQEADSFLKKAIAIEGRSFPNLLTEFDVAFEIGDYARAKRLLDAVSKDVTYGYLFRRSKYEHYSGSLDSSISLMLQAADKAANNKYLQQVALSNAADLYIHKGNLKKAAQLYEECIRADASDFHSLLGLGWVALVYDKNDSLAENIFTLVHRYNHSPDAILKMEQLAEARNDSITQKTLALQYEVQVSDNTYGHMYSKYLIDLYTGILHEPSKAVGLALAETANRPTPQVFAWYAWALYCNGEKEKAYQVFRSYVSQKPLEGIELYYMGKMMQGLDKGYNAQQFFKAAYKNRYDLSPAKVKDLENSLE